MKRNRMQQMSMEVTVGAFMFMILLALGFFTIILSSENIFAKKHYREIVFDDVMGLREGDTVTVRGLNVGKIGKLWLTPGGVHLRISTEADLDIHEGYRVEIMTSSVLGGKYLQVHEGNKAAPAKSPDAILRGDSPIDLIDEATATFGSIKQAMVDGGILDNLKVMLDELKKMSLSVNAGKGTLGKLITNEAAYNHFVSLASNLEEVSLRLKDGNGTLGRLLADDVIYEDLRAVAANARVISDRLRNGEGSLARLLSDDDELYNDLKQAVKALKTMGDRISNGEGTLGKLATDDALYEEARLLLQEIRAGVDDFRETAPITTFSSIFFGAL